MYQQKIQQVQVRLDEENAKLQKELQECKQEDEKALEESFLWQRTLKQESQKARLDGQWLFFHHANVCLG